MEFDQGFTFLIVRSALPSSRLQETADTLVQLLPFRPSGAVSDDWKSLAAAPISRSQILTFKYLRFASSSAKGVGLILTIKSQKSPSNCDSQN
jgi:hypothetical protein